MRNYVQFDSILVTAYRVISDQPPVFHLPILSTHSTLHMRILWYAWYGILEFNVPLNTV